MTVGAPWRRTGFGAGRQVHERVAALTIRLGWRDPFCDPEKG